MKFTNVAKAEKKAASIIGILILIFLLGGCLTPLDQVGQTQKCSKAEKAVDEAQKQYDDAFPSLVQGHTDERTNRSVALKVQKLQEVQEKAFEMCNLVQ
jgi:PBP1b-binding outer membrane lipoprotein LpoB